MNPNELFEQMLSDQQLSEQDYQDFLETNSELFYPAFELNHGFHLDIVLSKFPLDTALKTDFVYLTKSSAIWWVVLVEIEHPCKRLFNKDLSLSSDLNHAITQIESWRIFCKRNGEQIKRKLAPLLNPLGRNSVEFKFVLVVGRSDELKSAANADRFVQLQQPDFRLLTFDSFYHGALSGGGNKKDIMTLVGQKFQYKVKNHDMSGIIHWLRAEHFDVSPAHLDEARLAGYPVDAWLKGDQSSFIAKLEEDFFDGLKESFNKK